MTLQRVDVAASRERRWWGRLRLAALVAVLVPLGLLVQASIAYQTVVALTPAQYDELEAAFLLDDGRTLGVTYMHGHCEVARAAHIVEQSEERVVLSVEHRSKPWPDSCILIGYGKVSYFELEAPLGVRAVYGVTRDGLEPLKVGTSRPDRWLPPTEFRVD